MNRAETEELVAILEEQERRFATRKFYRMFPDETYQTPDGETVYARHLYPKHVEFFNAGKDYRERCFLAGNRVGKTVTGSYEATAHLTGEYPHWWGGREFKTPTRGWAAGKTNETTRDIVQAELLGEIVGGGANKGFSGTGMIPADRIGKITWKAGVSDLADTVQIKHNTGRWSLLGLKSYQQGRGSFEGTAQHFILTDEEPPIEVYGECIIRTMTTNGLMLVTFTPLEGLSETVLQFMPADMQPDGPEEDDF